MSIRLLTANDVTKEYVDWFSDPETMKYSDNRFQTFTLEGQRQYILEKSRSTTEFLYGIFDNSIHIGNVFLGPINFNHLHGEITYLIGNRNYWGKDVATQAVKEVMSKAFNEFNLRKLYAGCYSNNLGSVKVLEKCGFILEGRRKEHLSHEDNWVDHLIYGCFPKKIHQD